MKISKRHQTDGIELQNQDKIRTLVENEVYKYLGILGWHHQTSGNEKQNSKRISQEKLKTTRDKAL